MGGQDGLNTVGSNIKNVRAHNATLFTQWFTQP